MDCEIQPYENFTRKPLKSIKRTSEVRHFIPKFVMESTFNSATGSNITRKLISLGDRRELALGIRGSSTHDAYQEPTTVVILLWGKAG